MQCAFGLHLYTLLCHFSDLSEPADDYCVALASMGNQAVSAYFDTLRVIRIIAPAAFAQRVQRTIAEQAVEALLIICSVTWEVLTLPVAEKGVPPLFHQICSIIE
jgi:hypothetical protein